MALIHKNQMPPAKIFSLPEYALNSSNNNRVVDFFFLQSSGIDADINAGNQASDLISVLLK